MTAVAELPVARSLWAKRGTWALLDQALFAGSGLLVNVLLARELPATEYGAFAVAYLLFMLAGAAHTSLLTEPMLVFGAGKHAGRLLGYRRVLLRAHVAVSAVASAALAAAAAVVWLAGAPTTAATLAALAGALPFILLVWLLRRVFYVRRRPERAVAGDAAYAVLTGVGLVALARLGALSAPAALAVMAAAAAVASVLLFAVGGRAPDDEVAPAARAVLGDHWGYGRWSMLEQGVYWVSSQLVIVLVPFVLGLRAAATIAAVLNLFRPLSPALQSALGLILPEVSASAARGAGAATLSRQLRRFLVPYTAVVLAYGAVLTAFAGPVLHVVYGGTYDGQTTLVLLFALSFGAIAIVQVLTAFLKATGHVRQAPLIWAVSAVVALPLSLPAMVVAGAEGAVAVFLLSYVIAAAVAWRRAQTVAAAL